MEHRTSQQQQEQEPTPKLCVGGCGFWGNPACMDLCSKCYREQQQQQQKQEAAVAAIAAAPAPAAAAAPEAASPVPAPKPAEVVPEPVAVKPAAAQPVAAAAPAEAPAVPEAEPEKPVQANRSRCFCCNKKVGLLGFECRCGFTYCASHRHANEHNCGFDYKAMDRARLAKANPTVAASRVDKI